MLMEAFGLTSPTFVLQWHITDFCDQHCKHCYMSNVRIHSPFSFTIHCQIIDDFIEMAKTLGVRAKVNFTGGDPLLHPQIWEIMAYTISKGASVRILGNSFHVNEETVDRLKTLGIYEYQFSLDGMESTHDYIRRDGSFADTVRAIELLSKNGLRVDAMYTVSKLNAHDFPDLARFVSKIGIFRFSFGRLVPSGCGKNLEDQLYTAPEYRAFLYEAQATYEQLIAEGSETTFVCRDPLWTLLNYEQGRFKPSCKTRSKIIESGCGLGIAFLVLLADGSVWACRRFKSLIGRVPKQKLLDIFLNSPRLNEYRQVERLEKCRDCELLRYCRGCASVACNVSGLWTAPDPQCWKEVKT